MTFLQVGNRDIVRPFLEEIQVHMFALPPLMMFFVTAKGFIFLILSLIVIIAISSSGWKASNFTNYDSDSDKYQKSAKTNFGFEDVDQDNSTPTFNEMMFAGRENTATLPYVSFSTVRYFKFRLSISIKFIDLKDEPHELSPREEDRYQDTTKQVFPYTNKYNSQQRSVSPIGASMNTRSSENVVNRNTPKNYQNRDIEDRLSSYQQSDGETKKTIEPRNKYSKDVYPSVIAIETNRNTHENRQKPYIPPKPSNRNSTQPVATVERTDSRNSNRSDPADVLRGQMPWSYFKSSKDAPKKVFTHVVEEPVPDYPMFPRPKLTSNSDDQDGGKTTIFFNIISEK